MCTQRVKKEVAWKTMARVALSSLFSERREARRKFCESLGVDASPEPCPTSVNLTWNRKWLENQVLRGVEVENVEIERRSLCSEKLVQVLIGICHYIWPVTVYTYMSAETLTHTGTPVVSLHLQHYASCKFQDTCITALTQKKSNDLEKACSLTWWFCT